MALRGRGAVRGRGSAQAGTHPADWRLVPGRPAVGSPRDGYGAHPSKL